MQPNIAIDGPAGAGKSTVARLVARELGLIYVDTGAMYRALTWKALNMKLPFEEESLATLAQNTQIVFLQEAPGTPQKILCDGINVTDSIRNPIVSQHVSALASFGKVRLELTRLQQRHAAAGGVVMDGRDIGTYVLPNAPFKFFLTASLETRSLRRYRELLNKGIPVSLSKVRQDIAIRDEADQNRDIAPLAVAKDAEVIDTTDLTIDQVVQLIVTACLGGN